MQFDPFQWLKDTWQAQTLPQRLTDRVQYMLEQTIKDKTNEGYKSAYRQYIRFCNQYFIQPLPLNEITLVYWIAYRLDEVKASSILTNLSGVKYMAKIHGVPLEEKKD